MNEFRLALRSLRNRPLFVVVAVLTLALGIGATTTLFTIVNAVLLRPLPYPDASRIVSISESQQGKDEQVVVQRHYAEWQRASRAFEALATYSGTRQVITGRGEPVQVTGDQVSSEFFRVFGARAMLGRTFRPEEGKPGGDHVVVLSHALWTQLGTDSAIVGQVLTLDGTSYTAIGVMPPGFAAPRAARYWTATQLPTLAPGYTFFLQVVGRLRAGVDPATVQRELTGLSRRIPEGVSPISGKMEQRDAVVMTLHERMFGSTRQALLLLFGAVGFLLLIACSNVANLLLARAASREREFAVRTALGASRWRLARQLMAESVVVSVVGGALGLLIPLWSLSYFLHMSPASVARVGDISIDPAVLAFAVGVSVLTGLLFGLVPALTATRGQFAPSLKEGVARTTGNRTQYAVRRSLIVGELAIALVLLTGAGLLTQSLRRAAGVDLGFQPEHALSLTLFLHGDRYNDTTAVAFFDRLAERARALPGVTAAGHSNAPLVSGYRMTTSMLIPHTTTKSPQMAVAQIGPGYLQAMGSEVVAGHLPTKNETNGIVLSSSAAAVLYPHESAVGQTPDISLGGGTLTVVAVVKDVQQPGSDTPRLPQIYIPATAPFFGSPAVLAVRYSGAAEPVIAALRTAVKEQDPLQLGYSLSTMDDQMSEYVAARRFNAVLIDVFAGLALLLAAVGLYGVMAFQVAERTRELGIRMALGADRGRVLRFILREGMGLTLLGTAVGLALSLGLTRLLASLLYGIGPRDVLTFSAVPVALILVGLVACYLPAHRATRVDPMVALRYE